MNRALLVLGGALLAGVVGFAALRGGRSSPEPGAATTPAAEGPRRAYGEAFRYSLDVPAGWQSLDAGALKERVAADLDLALERADHKGRAWVLIEALPPGFAPDPDEYAEILVANMKKRSADLTVLGVEPLRQDPDSGVLHDLEMSNGGERVQGYFATLLTPRWGFRLLVTAPKDDFPAVQAEMRQILAGLSLPPEELPPRLSFEDARRAPTRLVRHGPSPQKYEDERPPAGVQAIHYDSGPLSLKASWVPPRAASGKKAPALVYLHGGFAYGNGDLTVPLLFRDAGFAALVPTYRGENGNPGEFELFRGEVDDAAAAVRWVAARKEVDPTRIYVFGHSTGGGLASLLALVPGLPLRRVGNAGGAYTEQTFFGWAKDGHVPFDPSDRAERRARILGPFLGELRTPLHLYAGSEDRGSLGGSRVLAARARRLGSPLQAETVAGDHATSLEVAARRFLELARKDEPPG